jgi:hypothetical protein
MELYEVGCMIAALQSNHHIITIKVVKLVFNSHPWAKGKMTP